MRSGLSAGDLAAVPEPVAVVLTQALKFEPLDRPRDMQAFRDELELALTRVEGAFRWPDAATVSYAPDEVEPEIRPALLASEPSEPTRPPAAVSEPLQVRPPHLVTRTLAIFRTKSRERRLLRGWLPLAAAGLVVLAVFISQATKPPTRNEERTDPPRVAAQSNLTVIRPAAVHVEPDPAPAPVPPAKRLAPPPATQRRSVSAPAAVPSSIPAAVESAKTEPRPVGANRSPIID